MKCGVQCTFNVQCDVMRKMSSATIQCNAIYWAAVTAVQLLYDKNKQLILLNFCHFDFPRQISERHVNCHSNAQDISWQSTLVYKTLRNNPSEGPTQYNSSLCSVCNMKQKPPDQMSPHYTELQQWWTMPVCIILYSSSIDPQCTFLHPKKDKICRFCFSVQKKMLKKCANSHDKILRQNCVNHQNKNNWVSTGIFVENILFLNIFIKKESNDWT